MGGGNMAKPKVPEDVAASIQRSIEVSPRGSRRVRCHSLRDLFGFQAWKPNRSRRLWQRTRREPLGLTSIERWMLAATSSGTLGFAMFPPPIVQSLQLAPKH